MGKEKLKANKPLALLGVLLLVASSSFAYDNEAAHPALTENATRKSGLNEYLQDNLGFSEGIEKILKWGSQSNPIIDLITKGSELEDVPNCRATNHFHNPLLTWGQSHMTDQPWGIDAACLDWKPFYSNVTWATGYLAPSGSKASFSQDAYYAPVNWDKARAYYYKALTITINADREKNLIKTFQAVGQVMHLLQDMSVPAHTRNDFQSHLIKNNNSFFDRIQPFENFVRINANLAASADPLNNFPLFANPRLTDFWDADIYDGNTPSGGLSIGLAEYSNANYFSDYTIPNNNPTQEHAFPFPAINSATYQVCPDLEPSHPLLKRKYISRKSKGPCPPISQARAADHFAAISFLDEESGDLSSISLWLDDNVHNTYAKELLPRAVGYSAGLLNYFFRGDIEISPLDNVLYAVTGPGGDFRQVRLKAKNNTANGEAMDNGQIHLVIKYKLAQSDPFQSEPVDVSDSYYIIVPEKNGLTAIPADEPVELIFDLADSGTKPAGAVVPLWATDVYLQVVYKGQLGNELDAVAVGFKDISEPTPVDLVNHMDLQCMNGSIYTAGSQEALEIVDTNHNGIADEWDIYPHGMAGNEVWFSPAPVPQAATERERDLTFPSIPSGQYGRTYILTEPNETLISMSLRFNYAREDSRDTCLRDPRTLITTLRGVKNQTDYIDGEYITTYPILSLIRGVRVWSGIAVQHVSYPDSSTCYIYNTAQPSLTGPVSGQTP